LKRQATDNICERVSTFGVRTRRIFGNDAVLVYRTLAEEAGAVRNGAGPALVEAYTYRWNSHVGPEDDSINEYRSADELAFWKNNCPIDLLGEKLEAAGHLGSEWITGLESEIAVEIEACFRFAKQSAFPNLDQWRTMNYDESTPVADRLLGTERQSEFDQHQPEAKLAPY
jgi:pyruvate dehydrogenase E1 component alpha subunit